MILTELTFAILKYAFLVLLWVFVWLAVSSLRRDIEVFSPRKKAAKVHKNRRSAKESIGAVPMVSSSHAPPKPQDAQPSLLVIIDGPLAGSSFPLGTLGVSLGRSSSNTVVLDDEFVSAQHARVYFDQSAQSWVLEDLGSTNGTMIGHTRVSNPIVLPARTPVRIGATMFELR